MGHAGEVRSEEDPFQLQQRIRLRHPPAMKKTEASIPWG